MVNAPCLPHIKSPTDSILIGKGFSWTITGTSNLGAHGNTVEVEITAMTSEGHIRLDYLDIFCHR